MLPTNAMPSGVIEMLSGKSHAPGRAIACARPAVKSKAIGIIDLADRKIVFIVAFTRLSEHCTCIEAQPCQPLASEKNVSCRRTTNSPYPSPHPSSTFSVHTYLIPTHLG